MSELDLDFQFEFGNLTGGGHDIFSESMALSDEAALLGILAEAPDDLGAINSLAHIYKQRGELDKAEAGYRQILNFSGRNKSAQSVAYYNLGSIYVKRGGFDQALEYYENSRILFVEQSNVEGMALTFYRMGNIYRILEETELSEEFYNKSLEINISQGKDLAQVADYTSLGLLYLQQEKLEKAETMYKKALEIDMTLGRKEGMAVMLGNIGAVARKKGELEAAKEHWIKSLEMFKELGMDKMVIKVQRWLDFLPK